MLHNLARQKLLVLILVGLLPIIGRVAELSWNPPPAPVIPDESAYLLAGDTFAHARLTNPTQPFWIHFETFHVIQHPTYATKFPFAQGLILAFGQICCGRPWFGVLLSIGVMCAALCWMLQGWVSPKWALIGGVLVAAMFFHHYWMESYWGGAAAAIGGALVIGAMRRLQRGSFKAAWWMSVGLILLASSRPYEGLLVAAPATAAVLFWSHQHRRLWSTLARLCCLLIPFALFSLYYNWRVTGNMMQLPYTLYDATYANGPLFYFQHLPRTQHYNNPQMALAYTRELQWFKSSQGVKHAYERLIQILGLRPHGYQMWLWAPLNLLTVLALPWLISTKKLRVPLLCFAFAVLGMILTKGYFEHYSAPILGLRLLFWVECLRYVSHFTQWRHSLVARLVPVTVVLGCLLLISASLLHSRFRVPQMQIRGLDVERPRIIAELAQEPGKHLVLVQYSEKHDPGREWVFNGADIDNSRVAWARMINGVDPDPLLRYFSDRRVWVVRPDDEVVRLIPVRGDLAASRSPGN